MLVVVEHEGLRDTLEQKPPLFLLVFMDWV
jgi:hypothetical protein